MCFPLPTGSPLTSNKYLLLCHMAVKIKGQIPHVGAGMTFSGPWYLAFPVGQVSVYINGSNFNWRFAPNGKRIKALLISALR